MIRLLLAKFPLKLLQTNILVTFRLSCLHINAAVVIVGISFHVVAVIVAVVGDAFAAVLLLTFCSLILLYQYFYPSFLFFFLFFALIVNIDFNTYCCCLFMFLLTLFLLLWRLQYLFDVDIVVTVVIETFTTNEIIIIVGMDSKVTGSFRRLFKCITACFSLCFK